MSDEGHTERLETALDGKYRIERKLGEGGMASVYLAEDIKHKRNVALKILRPELAAVLGAERFLAEIQTTANLQHPHILPLFDSGEADGYLYYVMPYIDGETLREKLDREKQLGVEEAVRIARDVADALDYAHRAGVIHRDIKPGNILLHDGRPVVADFGIALAVSAAGGGRMTETGLSLGTPHYMSPEQASADRDLSARSDVYSLGCVLYEMLAGQPPHTGPSAQSILVHILTKDVTPLTEHRHTVPPHISATVAKAIEKLPADRFETAKDFMAALEDEGFAYQSRSGDAAATQILTAAPDGGPSRPWLGYRRSVAAVVGAIGLAAVAAIGWLRPVPTLSPPMRVVTTPAGGLDRSPLAHFDISPDGRWIAWVADPRNDESPLYLRRANDPVGAPIPDTENALSPVFSPGGDWIAFAYEGAIRRVSVSGGPALTVTADGFIPEDWTEDGMIFGANTAGDMLRVAAIGGIPEVVLPRTESNELARHPHVLPGGEAVLYTSFTTPQDSEIRLLDLASGAVRTLVDDGWDPMFLPTGHILYGHRDQALLAVAFDPDNREVVGDPVPVLERVMVTSVGTAQFAVSVGGTAIYQPEGFSEALEVVLIDTEGSEEPVPIQPGPMSSPRFSPDGRSISFVDGLVLGDVYVFSLDLGNTTRLTFEGINQWPSWSPDSALVVFASERLGSDGRDVYRVAADMGGTAQPLIALPGAQHPQDWAADGSLLYREISTESGYDLRIASFEGDTVAHRDYLTADWDEYAAQVSPDGRWVAYVSDEDGEAEVYVRSYPTPGGSVKVSVDGGGGPFWHPGGGALYYRSPGGDLIRAQVDGTSQFSVTGRAAAFSADDYYDHRNFAQIDISPSGDRFVALKPASSGPLERPQELIVVTNWFEELRERMGEN